MPHENTVFRGLLKQIPWGAFDRLVDEHDADRRVRTLSTKSQLVALLYGQLWGAASLRDIETGLASHAAKLYHLGADTVQRSTLADANAKRPHEVFTKLFAQLVAQAEPGLRRHVRGAIRLIDATSIKLGNWSAGWATFSPGVFGAKVHVAYDPQADCPLYFVVTPANVNDITPAKTMPIDPEATYVFDLGYYDFGWWAALDAAGCRIVTRLKSNTPLDIVAEAAVPEGQDIILSDKIGHLPQRLSYSRKNPFQDPVREIFIRIDTGKVLRLMTNDLDAPAQEIADLYKKRWQVELFFRWVKQVLKIKHFLGTSENAVRIQIAVALIAFVLLRMAQAAQRTVKSPLVFARLIRANLMHKRPIDRLIEPDPPQVNPSPQFNFGFAPC
jgi:hypothetical protein